MLSEFLQNQEQMRLNTGKKLKTASLNPRFTGSKKEECTSICSVLKPKDLKLLLACECTYLQSQGHLTSFKKIIIWKEMFLFHIDSKI